MIFIAWNWDETLDSLLSLLVSLPLEGTISNSVLERKTIP
jgi:hypothetical protein